MAMFNFDFSPEGELRRERARMELERLRQEPARRAAESAREQKYSEGINEIRKLSDYTVGLEREAQNLESQIPQYAASGDPRAQIIFDRLKSLRDPQGGEIAIHRANLKVLDQNMKMQLAEGNPKLQMALVSEYLANAGVDPKAVKDEPTVKFKSKRKGKEFGDEDEISYDVPASVADKFIQSGQVPLPSMRSQQSGSSMDLLGALASSTQTGVPAADNNMFAQFQPAGGSVSPMSTGEQPITATNLFAPQPKAQVSPNPFTQSTASRPIPPEGSVVVQGGKRYRITNGVPTQIP